LKNAVTLFNGKADARYIGPLHGHSSVLCLVVCVTCLFMYGEFGQSAHFMRNSFGERH